MTMGTPVQWLKPGLPLLDVMQTAHTPTQGGSHSMLGTILLGQRNMRIAVHLSLGLSFWKPPFGHKLKYLRTAYLWFASN